MVVNDLKDLPHIMDLFNKVGFTKGNSFCFGCQQ